MSQKLSQEQKQKIILYYSEGKNINKISQILCLNEREIYNFLKQQIIPTDITTEESKYIIKLFREGLSIDQIENHYPHLTHDQIKRLKHTTEISVIDGKYDEQNAISSREVSPPDFDSSYV